jgi:uncharacterized protein YhaN
MKDGQHKRIEQMKAGQRKGIAQMKAGQRKRITQMKAEKHKRQTEMKAEQHKCLSQMIVEQIRRLTQITGGQHRRIWVQEQSEYIIIVKYNRTTVTTRMCKTAVTRPLYISVYTYVIKGFFSLNPFVSFSTQNFFCNNFRYENLEI